MAVFREPKNPVFRENRERSFSMRFTYQAADKVELPYESSERRTLRSHVEMRQGVAIYTDVGIEARVGEVIRFAANGRLIGVLAHRGDGLGRDYRVTASGTLVRDIF
jgi:hypothetical protein